MQFLEETTGATSNPSVQVLQTFTAELSGDYTITHSVSTLTGGTGRSAFLTITGSDGFMDDTRGDRVLPPDLTNEYTFTLVEGVEYTITVENGGGASSDSHTVTVVGDGDVDDDGIIDRLDLDSDNDGIADLVENFGPDVDNNGTVDGAFVDINANGLHDSFEGVELVSGGDFATADPCLLYTSPSPRDRG